MLTIQLHGVLVRLAGTERLEIDARSSQTVGSVLEQIAERWPQMAVELRRTACAVGDELLPRGAQVAPGAELNLLPPVSGG